MSPKQVTWHREPAPREPLRALPCSPTWSQRCSPALAHAGAGAGFSGPSLLPRQARLSPPAVPCPLIPFMSLTVPLTTAKCRFPKAGGALPHSLHPQGSAPPRTRSGARGGPAPHRHGVPVSRESVQVMAALGLPNENEFAAVAGGLWWGQGQWPQAPTVCPGLSPMPRTDPALPGTCHQRRWPCRGRGCCGRGAAPRHPSWLVGSHEAFVHSPRSLTPGEERGYWAGSTGLSGDPSRAAGGHRKSPGLRSDMA